MGSWRRRRARSARLGIPHPAPLRCRRNDGRSRGEGDRKLLVQAMITDGGVYDYATASKLTDALLAAQKEHLPQFA